MATRLAVMDEAGGVWYGTQRYIMVVYKEQCQQAIATWAGRSKVIWWCSLDEEAVMKEQQKRKLQRERWLQQERKKRPQGRGQQKSRYLERTPPNFRATLSL